MADAQADGGASDTYRAVMWMNGTGGECNKENLCIQELKKSDLGALGDDEVLIRVSAFALNPVDYKMNQLFPDYPKKHITGSDAAGTIIKVGANVSDFKEGDAVFMNSQLQYGTAAELVKASVNVIGKYDAESMSFATAAALPLVTITAMDAVNALGELHEATVMINGASGGVGTMAVQICKNVKGYKVIGICSGTNIDMVKFLGADACINYKEQDFAECEEKLDGFLDLVGGKHVWDKAGPLLEEDKRFVTIAGDDPTFASEDGKKSTAARAEELEKYVFVFYSTTREKLEQIAWWVKEGKVKARIDTVYKAKEIVAAMTALKSHRATGKIVLTW